MTNRYNGRSGNGCRPLPGQGGYAPKPPIEDGALNLKGWQQENAELQDEILRLKKLATQRGARMQIMLEWMNEQPAGGLTPGTIMADFFDCRPDAIEWFDNDGVPVDA